MIWDGRGGRQEQYQAAGDGLHVHVGVVFIYRRLVAAEPGTTFRTRLSPELNTR